MISISATVDTVSSNRMLKRVSRGLDITHVDRVVQVAAAEVYKDVVSATPKRWFGQLRRSWQIKKPEPGARVVTNPNKVMLFLEEGTGKTTGGRIYPKKAKHLYVPLTRRAAAGWSPRLKYGKDYVLKESVKGIKAQWIVAKARERAQDILRRRFKDYVKKLVTGTS